jgi:hypothetical protein
MHLNENEHTQLEISINIFSCSICICRALWFPLVNTRSHENVWASYASAWPREKHSLKIKTKTKIKPTFGNQIRLRYKIIQVSGISIVPDCFLSESFPSATSWSRWLSLRAIFGQSDISDSWRQLPKIFIRLSILVGDGYLTCDKLSAKVLKDKIWLLSFNHQHIAAGISPALYPKTKWMSKKHFFF